jgi:AraC-like DNA-binding protein
MKVSTIHLRAVSEPLEIAGVSSIVLRERAALGDDRLWESYGWVEMDVLDRVMALAVELTGDPALGLHWGERAPMLHYDLIPQTVSQLPTLRACLEAVSRFQSVLSERPELIVIERHDTVVVRCEPLAISALVTRVRADLCVASVARLLRHVGVPPEAVRKISFAHPLPEYQGEYRRLFGTIPRFAQECTSIEFARAELERTQRNRNVELLESLLVQGDRLRERVLSELRYSERVKREVRNALPHIPEMPAVAAALGISDRSLRRHLTAEGSSFSELVEIIQRDVAHELLEHQGHSMKEIAHRLGFETLSGFMRAYKRWTSGA